MVCDGRQTTKLIIGNVEAISLSIITILHNMEDLSQMTSTIVIGKIAAFEIPRKMGQ
jgi:hypothetical protein